MPSRRTSYFILSCCAIMILAIGVFLIANSVMQGDIRTNDWSPIQAGEPSLLFAESIRSRNDRMYSYENFLAWNRSLCSRRSDRRGPHQKVIAISVYGPAVMPADNLMFSWNTSILPLLESLSTDVNKLLPSWIIRMYVDFTGSTKVEQEYIEQFSNVDTCNIDHIPMFDGKLRTFLPGKMWRFLPVFDPFVDVVLSRDLDSPILLRETETLDMWLKDDQQSNIFYIARDYHEHGMVILGGLWGAAMVRDRYSIYDLFKPMLMPSIASLYRGTRDQTFLSTYIWTGVKNRSLIFDSYSCKIYGGRPFLSQRPGLDCFLGCMRPCCHNLTNLGLTTIQKKCPIACRPKEHLDWEYC